MVLSYCLDTIAANWLMISRTPPTQLITFGPENFEAFARLRFIPDPGYPSQEDSDLGLPGNHMSDIAQARRALNKLAQFTATPEECYFCLWEGYSDVRLPSEKLRGPLVELPHRRYALLSGSLRDLDGWEEAFGDGEPIPPPAFVWPVDHRW